MVSGSALDARIPWISGRQLGYWCEKGYVVPLRNGPPARGGGGGRVFSEAEARVLVVMARLVKAGVIAETAARAARAAVLAAGPGSVASVELDSGLRVIIEGV